MNYKTRQDPDVVIQIQDPYNWVYKDLPKKHHLLRKVPNCEYCGALKFPSETDSFCCRKGKVNIYVHELPVEMRRLFESQTDRDAKYFRKNIRYFNSHFSFTSFGATVDQRLATAKGMYFYATFNLFHIGNLEMKLYVDRLFLCILKGTGIYAFKVHGQIYHKLDQLKPGGKGPRHMQLYFYDTDENMLHRRNRSPHLDQNLLREILRILSTVAMNPYLHTFRIVG